jgi:mannuronan synthase
MRPQVVHESEVHRQHVRLKIPIQAEVDGIRYQVDDWSVGGFGVESVMTSRRSGEHLPVKLIFMFEEFDMIMRFDARMIYADQDHGRFGCAFLAVSQQQMEVFRYLVDAYLAGEVVSAGDILQVRARDNSVPARLQAVYSPYGENELWAARLRRYGTIAGFGLAGLVLLGLVALGIKGRYFTVASTHAVIEAPTVLIRAPLVGRFIAALQAGQAVPPESLLGTIHGLDGTAVALESPCECVVLAVPGLNGQHYQVGEPLVILIEAGQPLMVRAQLPLEEVERLQIGDRAEIRLPGQNELRSGQIERVDLRPGRAAWRSPDSDLPIGPRLAQVIVRPDRPFEREDFGALVALSFP